jgi:hypothetical protein
MSIFLSKMELSEQMRGVKYETFKKGSLWFDIAMSISVLYNFGIKKFKFSPTA